MKKFSKKRTVIGVILVFVIFIGLVSCGRDANRINVSKAAEVHSYELALNAEFTGDKLRHTSYEYSQANKRLYVVINFTRNSKNISTGVTQRVFNQTVSHFKSGIANKEIKEIDLKINTDHPAYTYKYLYKNNSWNRN